MSPVRLAILAVLFYIGYRLLKGNRSPTRGHRPVDHRDDGAVKDVLVEDPVCHTLVPREQAIRLRQGGRTYYFCSEACCDQFSDDSGGGS